MTTNRTEPVRASRAFRASTVARIAERVGPAARLLALAVPVAVVRATPRATVPEAVATLDAVLDAQRLADAVGEALDAAHAVHADAVASATRAALDPSPTPSVEHVERLVERDAVLAAVVDVLDRSALAADLAAHRGRGDAALAALAAARAVRGVAAALRALRVAAAVGVPLVEAERLAVLGDEAAGALGLALDALARDGAREARTLAEATASRVAQHVERVGDVLAAAVGIVAARLRLALDAPSTTPPTLAGLRLDLVAALDALDVLARSAPAVERARAEAEAEARPMLSARR